MLVHWRNSNSIGSSRLVVVVIVIVVNALDDIPVLELRGVRHLSYGSITQCYLPPHTSTRPALTPASKPVLDLPTPEGWKAELT